MDRRSHTGKKPRKGKPTPNKKENSQNLQAAYHATAHSGVASTASVNQNTQASPYPGYYQAMPMYPPPPPPGNQVIYHSHMGAPYGQMPMPQHMMYGHPYYSYGAYQQCPGQAPPPCQPPLPPTPKDNESQSSVSPPCPVVPNGSVKTHGNSQQENEGSSTSGRYKTKLCLYWLNSGGQSCKYGDKCNFAHGTEELRYSPEALASLQRELQFARQQAKKAEERHSKKKHTKKSQSHKKPADGDDENDRKSRSASKNLTTENNEKINQQGTDRNHSTEKTSVKACTHYFSTTGTEHCDHYSEFAEESRDGEPSNEKRSNRDDTQSSVGTDNPVFSQVASSGNRNDLQPAQGLELTSLNVNQANKLYDQSATKQNSQDFGSDDNIFDHTVDSPHSISTNLSLECTEAPRGGPNKSNLVRQHSFTDTHLSNKRFWIDNAKAMMHQASNSQFKHHNDLDTYIDSPLSDRLRKSSVFETDATSPISLVCMASSSTSQEGSHTSTSKIENSDSEPAGNGHNESNVTSSRRQEKHDFEYDYVDEGDTRTLISSVVAEALSTDDDENYKRHGNSFRLDLTDLSGSPWTPVQTAPSMLGKKFSFLDDDF